MGVSPFEILVGPAEVYLAPVGEAFTAVDTAPAGNWVDLGRTDGETQVSFDQDINPIFADQVTGALKAVRTREAVMVTLNFIDLTLETFGRVLNDATVTSDAGPPATKTITLYQDVDVNQHAMLLRFDSAYNANNGQMELPVVIQSEAPEVSFTREDKSILTSRWMTLEDQNAASDAEKFGRIVMDNT